MKKQRSFFIALLMLSAVSVNAQFLTLRATHASTFLSNNLYDPDMSKAYGLEGYFSKGIKFIPYNVNYNLGADFTVQDSIYNAMLVAGLTYIIATPSGFSATNPENVTYVTSNWLNYADLNLINGVQIADTAFNYQLAVEAIYNVGYAFGKHFFIHGGAGARYTMLPAFKETDGVESSSLDILFKFGILWKFSHKYNKP